MGGQRNRIVVSAATTARAEETRRGMSDDLAGGILSLHFLRLKAKGVGSLAAFLTFHLWRDYLMKIIIVIAPLFFFYITATLTDVNA
jgi:hypothetical protein